MDDRVPRHLPERTGRHHCTICLANVPRDEYLRNDHLCGECAERAKGFPLASTPGESDPEGADGES